MSHNFYGKLHLQSLVRLSSRTAAIIRDRISGQV